MKKAILRILLENRGKFVSGEELSKLLGVSRTAIWKQINSIKEDGYVIESVQRQGYRLTKMPDNLSLEEIRIRLDSKFFREIYGYNEVSSTNDIAKKKASEGAPEGTIVLADHQDAGKGRMGRAWISPPSKGICLSFVLRPLIMPSQASQLTFVSAVAVCLAIREYTGLSVKIKWPNDLIVNGKKICGILTELSAEIDCVNHMVVGIGVNVNQYKEDIPVDMKDKATSLALETGGSLRRTDLLIRILEKIEDIYHKYCRNGFEFILQQWRELNATLGQEVLVVSINDSFHGIAEDIDNEGQLLVRKPDGELQRVLAGDVSIRNAK